MNMRLKIAIVFLLAQLVGAAAQTSDKTVNKPGQPTGGADQSAMAPKYGDWQLHCSAPPQQKAQRSCEAVQAIFAKNQAQPVAQIAFGKPTPTEPLLITIMLPVNIGFPGAPRLMTADNDAHPVDLAWRRCVPIGCFANFVVTDEILKRWKALNSSGKITFKNAGGQDVAIPISFKGLAQAVDALAKQP
jgi:invasion protein IalB